MRFLPDPPLDPTQPVIHPEAIPYAPALSDSDIEWLWKAIRLQQRVQALRHPQRPEAYRADAGFGDG